MDLRPTRDENVKLVAMVAATLWRRELRVAGPIRSKTRRACDKRAQGQPPLVTVDADGHPPIVASTTIDTFGSGLRTAIAGALLLVPVQG